MRDRGQARDEIAHIARLDVGTIEERVGKHLEEVARQALIVFRRKRGKLDLKTLGELEEHAHRDWPLIALDKVQIAWRKAELGRHLRLRHVPFLAHAPELAADAN